MVCNWEMPKRVTLQVLVAGFLVVAIGWSAGQPSLFAQSREADVAPRTAKSMVKPEYPALARKMNLSGSVKIEIVIGTDGKVKRTRVVGGHPLLIGDAERAAKSWVFEAGPKETIQVLEFKFHWEGN